MALTVQNPGFARNNLRLPLTDIVLSLPARRAAFVTRGRLEVPQVLSCANPAFLRVCPSPLAPLPPPL
jgi:hypothetical protein